MRPNAARWKPRPSSPPWRFTLTNRKKRDEAREILSIHCRRCCSRHGRLRRWWLDGDNVRCRRLSGPDGGSLDLRWNLQLRELRCPVHGGIGECEWEFLQLQRNGPKRIAAHFLPGFDRLRRHVQGFWHRYPWQLADVYRQRHLYRGMRQRKQPSGSQYFPLSALRKV
jgi:hypothetical protein